MTTSPFSVLVRPKKEHSRTAILTFFVTAIPLFGLLYWYTASYHLWPEILAFQLVISAACLAVVLRQRKVFTAVSDSDLVGNGVFSRVSSVPLDRITHLAKVPIYNSDPKDTSVQFLALDRSGACLFRLRGFYWHASDLDVIATAIGRPVESVCAPLSRQEFYDAYPGCIYWFEKHYIGRAILIATITVVVGAIAVAILYSSGLIFTS